METLLASAQRAVGPACTVLGGVSVADAFSQERVALYGHGGTRKDGLSLLLFSGSIEVATVICNSWEPVGYREAPSGEILTLGTDGITESRNSQGELFGRERLKRAVSQHAHRSAGEIVTNCLETVSDFRAGLQWEDDETLVIFKVLED